MTVVETGTSTPEEEELARGPDLAPEPLPRPRVEDQEDTGTGDEEFAGANPEAVDSGQEEVLALGPKDSSVPTPVARPGSAASTAPDDQPDPQPAGEEVELRNPTAQDASTATADAPQADPAVTEDPDSVPTKYAPESAPAAPRRPASV